MEFHNINFKIDDRVARITLARPPLNVLNIAMMREINQALHECELRRDLAAIVFDTAEGSRAFSAGVAIEEHVAGMVFKMLDTFHGIFRSLAQISKPVVAIVDGPALGGGCEFIAACDIVIASDRARFGQPEIKLGVFPPVAAILLPRIIGDKKAREMILLGEMVDAAEAQRLGLVSQVVPSSALKREAEGVLARLRDLSGASLHFTRAALELGRDRDFEATLAQVEDLYLNELMKTEDAIEGVRSFMEKRKPEWRNK